MKILALEVEVEGGSPERFEPHLRAEARRVWELYQSGVIREIYFRADRSEAVYADEIFLRIYRPEPA